METRREVRLGAPLQSPDLCYGESFGLDFVQAPSKVTKPRAGSWETPSPVWGWILGKVPEVVSSALNTLLPPSPLPEVPP